jgi:hypothetical protein
MHDHPKIYMKTEEPANHMVRSDGSSLVAVVKTYGATDLSALCRK